MTTWADVSRGDVVVLRGRRFTVEKTDPIAFLALLVGVVGLTIAATIGSMTLRAWLRYGYRRADAESSSSEGGDRG